MIRRHYVRLTVHEDIYDEATELLTWLENKKGYDHPKTRALRDLLEPLPEPDINGVTPTKLIWSPPT